MITPNSHSSRNHIVLLASIALIASVVGATSYQVMSKKDSNSNAHGILDFNLSDENAIASDLSEYAGQRLMLNFWASWCEPCREEIPLLNEHLPALQAAQIQLVGIAIDSAANVNQFQQQVALDYPNLNAEQKGMIYAQKLGNQIGALPFTVLINAAGEIEHRHLGELNPELLKNWMRDEFTAEQ